MQTLYLNIEDRVRIKRKAVVFGQKLCKIVFIEALYLVDPALNIDIFRIVEKSDELFGLCQVIVALEQLAHQAVQARIYLCQPAAMVDAVCDIGKSLRAEPADVLEEVFFQYLTVQAGDAVYLIARSKAEVCHVNLPVLNYKVLADLFAVTELGYKVLAPAAVYLAQYLPHARQKRLHQILRPFFKRLAHDGVVRVGNRSAHLIPRLVPAEAVLVHHDAHKLRNDERRVRIVYLDPVVLREAFYIAEALYMRLYDRLRSGREEEILLL